MSRRRTPALRIVACQRSASSPAATPSPSPMKTQRISTCCAPRSRTGSGCRSAVPADSAAPTASRSSRAPRTSSPMRPREREALGELADGPYRLACQTYVTGDVSVSWGRGPGPREGVGEGPRVLGSNDVGRGRRRSRSPASPQAGGRCGRPQVLVLWHGNSVYAFQNICIHQERELVKGVILNNRLICAGHQWAFELGTGWCREPSERSPCTRQGEGDVVYVGDQPKPVMKGLLHDVPSGRRRRTMTDHHDHDHDHDHEDHSDVPERHRVPRQSPAGVAASSRRACSISRCSTACSTRWSTGRPAPRRAGRRRRPGSTRTSAELLDRARVCGGVGRRRRLASRRPARAALANGPGVHNVVVCTPCSCYPMPLLGPPPRLK